MAAPREVVGLRAHPRVDGVRRDVGGDGPQVGVVADALGVVAPLEEVAAAAVERVERLRVVTVAALHPPPEVRLRRLDEQVDVVVHEAVREQQPSTLVDLAHQQPEVQPAIVVADEQWLAVVPARIHVVHCTGLFFTWPPRHTSKRPRGTKLAPWGV